MCVCVWLSFFVQPQCCHPAPASSTSPALEPWASTSGRHVWGEVGLLRGFLHAEEPAALGIHTSAGAWRGEDEDRLNATQIVQGSSQQVVLFILYVFLNLVQGLMPL
jgi:hypothetical protein